MLAQKPADLPEQELEWKLTTVAPQARVFSGLDGLDLPGLPLLLSLWVWVRFGVEAVNAEYPHADQPRARLQEPALPT